MIKIIKNEDCCGCNACGDVCPKKSISFEFDAEGFLYPIVNKNTCIDCHLCEKTCPIIQSEQLKSNDFHTPICYAAQTRNLESLFNSTSGSAFASFAEAMYKKGGYVGGAIFNDDYSVTQFISSNKEDLAKLRNSKYVQSNSEGFYKQVQGFLNSGEHVLVCGLPCQIAALKAFLRKHYDNLITVDLICLGINSPKILRGYLDYMEEKHNSKIVYYKAKNKEFGWRQLTTKIVFENGDVEYDKKDTSYFTYGFISTHVFSRPSCYNCRFKGFPRIADITIGDYWGAEKTVGDEYDHDLGTSIIMINSQIGLNFFEKTKSSFRCKEVAYESTLNGNKALLVSQPHPSINRDNFYKDLNSMKFEEVAKKYIHLPNLQPSYKLKIKNILKFIIYSVQHSGLNIRTLWQNIFYNILSSNFETDITKGNFLLFDKYCVVDIHKKSKIKVNGMLFLGRKEVKGSKIETKLQLRSGSLLTINGGTINSGADIEVFQNAQLYLGKRIAFNVNTTIICGDKIYIQDDVCFGRCVTVRDNNGGHFIARRTFKDKRPIYIGAHSWICEQSIVMPGTKLGVGVIVGANSMVSGKVGNFVFVSGSPAQIVDEEIYWKS